MLLTWWLSAFRNAVSRPRNRPARRRLPKRGMPSPQIERLEDRAMLSISSSFDVATGELQINTTGYAQAKVVIDHGGGAVRLNGEPVVVTGPGGSFRDLAASEVCSLVVNGGIRDDLIDLSAVTSASFTSLTSVRVAGTGGDDTIIGSAFGDTLNGGRGDDSIHGGDGHDLLLGGTGSDFLNGGLGDDRVRGQGGSRDTVIGGPGDDTLSGGMGTDALFESTNGNLTLSDRSLAGSGTDTLRGIETAELTGGDGDNRIVATGFSGPTSLSGGDGNDYLAGGGNRDVLNGGFGDDSLIGGAGDDTLYGSFGNDMLWGGSGDDGLQGGSGNDFLDGQAGADTLLGDHLSDSLMGGDGDDLLLGHAGNDSLDGGSGRDTIAGGDGDDTVVAESGEIDESHQFLSAWVDAGSAQSELFAVPDIGSLQTLTGLGTVQHTAVVEEAGRGGIFVYYPLDTETPSDNGTVFLSADGGRWIRRFDRDAGYSVAWFGAVGDGIADDTQALQAAFDGAGIGGTVVFSPGSVYRTSAAIRMLEQQTLSGYGATLVRCDEITAETTSAVSRLAGSNPSLAVVTVDDASRFAVGMDVAIFNESTFSRRNHRIVAISGNTLHLLASLEDITTYTAAFRPGSTIVTSFNQLEAIAGPEINILGLTLDGNAVHNTALRKWVLHSAIRVRSDNGLVRGVSIFDAQADAIIVGGDNILVDGNRIDTAAGNGIHLSGGDGIRITNNDILNTNLGSSSIGHVGGCIEYSSLVPNSVITGNLLRNGRAGIAGFDTPHPDGATITNNTIINAREMALDAYSTYHTIQGSMVFADNYILDSVKLALYNINIDATGSERPEVCITGNTVVNTRIEITNSRAITLSGNTWVFEDSLSVIRVEDCEDVRIDDTVRGGAYGVYVKGAASRRISISGSFINNQWGAIYFDRTTAAGADFTVNGVRVTAESGQVGDSYVGLIIRENVSATNNTLDVQGGRWAIWMIGGGPGRPGAVATGNTILSAASIPSVHINANGENHVVTDNLIQQDIRNSSDRPNVIARNQPLYL